MPATEERGAAGAKASLPAASCSGRSAMIEASSPEEGSVPPVLRVCSRRVARPHNDTGRLNVRFRPSCAPKARPSRDKCALASDVFRVRCRMSIEHNNEPFVIGADRRAASAAAAECARLRSRWPPGRGDIHAAHPGARRAAAAAFAISFAFLAAVASLG
ncbi:hypothetical protein MTO96_015537 [Rhipicephalus appendiculatus]